jgi:hypothetical protein
MARVINERREITTVPGYSLGITGDEDYDAVTLSPGFN